MLTGGMTPGGMAPMVMQSPQLSARNAQNLLAVCVITSPLYPRCVLFSTVITAFLVRCDIEFAPLLLIFSLWTSNPSLATIVQPIHRFTFDLLVLTRYSPSPLLFITLLRSRSSWYRSRV